MSVATLPTSVGREEITFAFSLFNHAAHQLHGVTWAASYTATDARPEAALMRARRYAVEKMINPPPLLMVVDQCVYAIRRQDDGGMGIGRVTRHATGVSALATWLEAASTHPSVESRYRGIIRQVTQAGVASSDGNVMVLPLVMA